MAGGAAGVAASPGGRRVLEFVSAWDALAPRLSAPAAGGGAPGGDALRTLLEALKLAVPALQAADGSGPCGRPRAQRALAVAALLADLGADASTVAAALLAEAVEAGTLPLERVAAALGPACSALVHDVARVRALPARAAAGFDDAQAARLRTFCLAFHDVRAVLVELAARCDALRHADALPPFARSQLALETMQLYAPMAHAMAAAARDLRFELEDRAFEILFPRSYAAVADWLRQVLPAGEAALGQARSALEAALAADEPLRALLGPGGRAAASARVKSRYSTMAKLLRDGRGREAVHDLLGLRVVLHCGAEGASAEAQRAACYRAQQLAHALWEPREGRSKDYIAAPKPNGYASLHSTLRLGPGLPDVELQVRSADMQAQAEGGAAAHTAYKAGVIGAGEAEALTALLAAAEQVAQQRFPAFAAGALPPPSPHAFVDASAVPMRAPADDDAIGAAVFAAFDKDGDGAITLAELAAVVGELSGAGGDGGEGVAAAAAELMALADADASGTVTAVEFGALRRRIAQLQALPAEDAATQRNLAQSMELPGQPEPLVLPAAAIEAPAAAEPLLPPTPAAAVSEAAPLVAEPGSVAAGTALLADEREAARERTLATVDALVATGDLYSAREVLRGATTADPAFTRAWTRWAGLEAEAGRRRSARSLHQAAAVWAPTTADRARALLRGALYAASDRRPRDARSIFRKAVAAAERAGPGDGDLEGGPLPVLHAWARFELKEDDPKAARELLNAAWGAAYTRGEKVGVQFLHTRALLEQSQRRWAAARRNFTQGLALEPDNTRLLQTWGRMEAQLGDLATARALFSRGLAANFRNAYVVQAWALAEMRAGCNQAARALLEHGLRVDPGNAPLWSALAQLEAAEGDLGAARVAYARGLEENPTNVPLLHALGRMELNAGDTAAARSLLRRALEVEPHSPAVLRELSTIDYADGREKQAEKLLTRADTAWAAGQGVRGRNKGGGRRKRWKNGMDDPELPGGPKPASQPPSVK